MDKHKIICPECNKEFPRADMEQTKDCHGITFRLVCFSCWKKIMRSKKGYDGEYYDERDENLDYEWQVAMKYYAIAKGVKPGIYTSWDECSKYVNGYRGAIFKSFSSKEAAEQYYKSFHENTLPNDKRYVSSIPIIKYKNTDNCVLCEKPFKQSLAKGGTGVHKSDPCCPLCRKKRKEIKSVVYKGTGRVIKGVTVDDLVYLKRILKVENIFEHLSAHPWDIAKRKFRKERNTALKSLLEQRDSYSKDASIKTIPVYIKEQFGKDKEVISVEGDKRNPVIIYHCKRCDGDYRVHWRHYLKVKGHNCSALISSGEAIVEDYLKEIGLSYKTQRQTLRCVNPDTGFVMPYDFEILGKKLLIEVQGEQHRSFVQCFHVDEAGFEYQKKKDRFKREFAEKNGYRLLELWYENFNDASYKQIINDAINVKQVKKTNNSL